MKNILLIAYYYPPLGGAGVQRTLKFAKYLTEIGYNIVILTVENDNTTVKDYTLEEHFDHEVKVYRVKQKELTILSKLTKKKTNTKNLKETTTVNTSRHSNFITNGLRRAARDIFLYLYRSIFVPDDKLSWKKNGIIMGEQIIEKEKIDLIISSSAPYSSHLIACRLKIKYNIPWIADFRDPWVDYLFVKYPFITELINKKLEKKVVNVSDAIVTVSKPIIENFYNRYPKISKSKFHEIPNGYDEEDFKDYELINKVDKFYITYCGTLYGKESPKEFLIAADNLLKRNLINMSDLKIRFIGNIGRDAQTAIDQFSEAHKDIIQCTAYLPHKESIKKIQETFALILMISGGEECKGVYTGKIFEYIRSNRVILGLVPDGVARDLIQSSDAGLVCYPDNIEEIENAILKLYHMYKGECARPELKWEVVKEYDRKHLTQKLSNIIELL